MRSYGGYYILYSINIIYCDLDLISQNYGYTEFNSWKYSIQKYPTEFHCACINIRDIMSSCTVALCMDGVAAVWMKNLNNANTTVKNSWFIYDDITAINSDVCT